MSHLDPDQLALLALGEHVATDSDRAHLSECRACKNSVADMTNTVRIARAAVDTADLECPPPTVWARIHDELRLHHTPTSTPIPPPPVEPPVANAPPLPPHLPRPRRRARTTRLWTLVASTVLLATIGVTIWGLLSPRLDSTVIVSATLEAFPEHPNATGHARVIENADGTRTLTVTVDTSPPSGDYLEVWMIREDGQAIISLGILDRPTDAFPVPAGLNLTTFNLVDVSAEPLDDDPTHSGDSIVRGQLRR